MDALDSPLDGRLARELSALLLSARHAAGVSQRQLAIAAGVSVSAVCRIERGARLPSLDLLQRLLAALGLQLTLGTELRDADLDRALESAAAHPGECGAAGLWGLVYWLPRVEHRVEGVAAAALLGVPVAAGELDIALADDDATLDQFARVIRDRLARAYAPPHGARLHPQTLREDIAEMGGRFLVDSCALEFRVRLAPPQEVRRHVLISSERGQIPVQPVDEIVVDDPHVTRVLRRLRERARTPAA